MMRHSLLVVIIITLALPGIAQAQTPPDIKMLMTACWDFSETSGTRNDSYGSNHLTDNNTVGYAAGLQGNAASFVSSNSEYLSIASNPDLAMTSSFTIAAWFRCDTICAGQGVIVGKWGTTSNREYIIRYNTTPTTIYAAISAASAIKYISHPMTLSADTWYFVVMRFDDVADQLSLKIDNANPQNVAAASIDSPGVEFRIGHSVVGGYLNGAVDQVIIWKRVISSDEETYLYNDGAGRSCQTILAAADSGGGGSGSLTEERQIELSSGDKLTLRRETSYGDLAVTLAVMVVGFVVSLGLIALVSERWLSKQ